MAILWRWLEASSAEEQFLMGEDTMNSVANFADHNLRSDAIASTSATTIDGRMRIASQSPKLGGRARSGTAEPVFDARIVHYLDDRPDAAVEGAPIVDRLKAVAAIRRERARKLDPRREDSFARRTFFGEIISPPETMFLGLNRWNQDGQKMAEAIDARIWYSLGQTLIKQFDLASEACKNIGDNKTKLLQWHWERMRLSETFFTSDDASIGLLTPKLAEHFNLNALQFLSSHIGKISHHEEGGRPNARVSLNPPARGRVYNYFGDDIVQWLRHRTLHECWEKRTEVCGDAQKLGKSYADVPHSGHCLPDDEWRALTEVGFYRPEHFFPSSALEGQYGFFRDCKYFSDLCDTYVSMRVNLVRDAGRFDMDSLLKLWGIPGQFLDLETVERFRSIKDSFPRDDEKFENRRKVIAAQRASLQRLVAVTCFWATSTSTSAKEQAEDDFAMLAQLGSLALEI